MLSDVERRFRELGGRFIAPAAQIAANLGKLRALVFDWDGVFNAGLKGAAASGFTEPDSMGTNMLRFALWRERGTQPACAILSGADNPAAREFARREHFHAVYCGFRDKSRAFESFIKTYNVESSEVAYVFDDINDLSVARACSLRILVRRDASPLFVDHAATHGLCDYVTAHAAGSYAVREACELLIGLLGHYGEVVTARGNVDSQYEAYFAERQRLETEAHDAQ